MSVQVIYNGTPYQIPTPGDTGWGDQVTGFIQNIATSSALQAPLNVIVDNATNATVYPVWTTSSNGVGLVPKTSTTQLYFNPATGTLTLPNLTSTTLITANTITATSATISATATIGTISATSATVSGTMTTNLVGAMLGNSATVTGSSDAITVTVTPTIAALTMGLTIEFKTNSANTTTTPTVNVSGLGPVTITNAIGLALTPNAWFSGETIKVMYDGTYFRLNNASAVVQSFALAGLYASQYVDQSSTSTTLGTGSKTFTVTSAKGYLASVPILFVSRANPLNWMYGTITSYSITTLVANITQFSGSGTYTDWNIYSTMNVAAVTPTDFSVIYFFGGDF